MDWLIVAVSCYLILSIVNLIDKYLLSKSIPSHRIYAFYVGLLGSVVLLLGFFVNFFVPDNFSLFLALFSGSVFIFALFWLYKSLHLFEASRVVPAIGGLTPLFIWLLTFFLPSGNGSLGKMNLVALFLLVSGSILITYKKVKFSYKSLMFSSVAAFLMALYFISAKYVYLREPFWNGFLWMRIGGVVASVFILVFSLEVKKEILKWFQNPFSKKRIKLGSKKTALIFIFNQIFGGISNILQNFSISLAPVVYIPMVSALQGTQYFFLFIFALIISLKFPKILKEEISGNIILQKIIAIILISGGVAILAIKEII